MGLIYGTIPDHLYGYGYGDGYGGGYGDGSGDGSGSGSGYGDGSGYGYGSGSGSGYASGSKEYSRAVIDSVLGRRAVQLRTDGVELAFWRSATNGTPANGGSGEPVSVGTIQLESGSKPCERGMLHGTLAPESWQGERLWIVALYPPFIHVDGYKIASNKREILAEVPNWLP